MKKRYLALPVSENHEDCVQKLDILRHVIHPDSMSYKRVFFTTKKRVRPVPSKSKDDKGYGIQTDQATCKVVHHKNLCKRRKKFKTY